MQLTRKKKDMHKHTHTQGLSVLNLVPRVFITLPAVRARKDLSFSTAGRGNEDSGKESNRFPVEEPGSLISQPF